MSSNLKVPVVSVEQPIGVFYVGSMTAGQLLEICRFDYRRMSFNNGYIDFLGIQRRTDSKRVGEIVNYVGTKDACFPTSIVIAVDEKCAVLEESELSGVFYLNIKEYNHPDDEQFSIRIDQVAAIIDGQHRLKGLQEAGALSFEVSVSIFIGADDATEATIFSTVNLAQTKVNRSLVYDLFSVAKSRSPEKTCHEIVVALDKMEESPFHNKIKRLGTSTEGRFGETLSQATVVQGLLPYISNDPIGDRDRGRRFDHFEPLNDPRDIRNRIFYPFFADKKDELILANIMNYFQAIRNRWPAAWANTGQGNIINRTNGYFGFMRFLRRAYLNFTTTPAVVSQQNFADLLNKVDLVDSAFTVETFPPGSSGASKLFNILREKTHI